MKQDEIGKEKVRQNCPLNKKVSQKDGNEMSDVIKVIGEEAEGEGEEKRKRIKDLGKVEVVRR